MQRIRTSPFMYKSRPKTWLSLVKELNETIAMDLKYWSADPKYGFYTASIMLLRSESLVPLDLQES